MLFFFKQLAKIACFKLRLKISTSKINFRWLKKSEKKKNYKGSIYLARP